MLVYLCAGHFVLLHHTKKQEEEKEGMCDSPGIYWCGCGQRALLWDVCEMWMCDRGFVDELICAVEDSLLTTVSWTSK